MTSPSSTARRSRSRLSTILWILQWALGVSLVVAGVTKLALPFADAAQFFPWASDVPALFTVTSVLDVLGGVGLIVPALTRVAPRLTVVAAVGVVLLMLSAVAFYLIRGEASEIAPNVVMAAVAVLIAVGRGRLVPITAQLAEVEPFDGTLPQASPPASMALYQLPTGTYATRAVFAFTGGAVNEHRDFASTAVLIRHPQGDLLIDAGFGANASEHIQLLPSFRRAPHTMTKTARDQLDTAGHDRSALLGVLLTHSHWDHVSGLDSLDTPVWMTAEESAYVATSKGDPVFNLVARDHAIREYQFDSGAYLGFDTSLDFFGDGSVVIVPASGHTSGSVIIFVSLPSAQRYAFIGDLSWQLEGVTERREKPLLMRMLADSDARRVRDDLGRIFAIAHLVQVVPAHDERGYVGIPLLSTMAAEVN